MADLNVRQRLEQGEERLSPFAAHSAISRGRKIPEEPCPLRTAFQRDRDRIIFCNAFRRLKHKTQVFITPLGDHYVTRLTHTLEVSQIARTISRALNLNEDLTEAIALGHDLGHTPFGHMGEAVLNELLPGGFRHYEQSLRVVECIENKGKGLNLTWEVRDGILNHSKGDLEILECGWDTVSTVEGQVVKMADMVAYINHDVEDAMRAGMISPANLPDSTAGVLGKTNSSRINTLVTDIVQFSADKLTMEKGVPAIGMSKAIRLAANELREFLFSNVYYANREKEEGAKARQLLIFLYDYFVRNPDQLPPEYNLPNETIERSVADYVSGMSDQYAILTARKFSESPIW
ncbi:MAG: deoxyguanosinetriphosphate triphosphohydrolase [Spirochaetales bacterium]|nr:MAG: deoxyguanosinetriphosphate triphosphohydrolase [Spirochaetales bacterium]